MLSLRVTVYRYCKVDTAGNREKSKTPSIALLLLVLHTVALGESWVLPQALRTEGRFWKFEKITGNSFCGEQCTYARQFSVLDVLTAWIEGSSRSQHFEHYPSLTENGVLGAKYSISSYMAMYHVLIYIMPLKLNEYFFC